LQVSPAATNPGDYAKAGDLPVIMLSDNAAALLLVGREIAKAQRRRTAKSEYILPELFLNAPPQLLRQEAENIQFRIWAPAPPRLDGNSALFWLLAMCALVSGSIWNTSKLRSRFNRACQTTVRRPPRA
jgi:hypothetical protein